MELKEVYEKIGGDYDDVVRRLMGEKLVRKFLLNFWMIRATPILGEH